MIGNCQEGSEFNPALLLAVIFVLQNAAFPKWAMLGSNQRPLPCEGSKDFSCVS
jgi:hypothetical protein